MLAEPFEHRGGHLGAVGDATRAVRIGVVDDDGDRDLGTARREKSDKRSDVMLGRGAQLRAAVGEGYGLKFLGGAGLAGDFVTGDELRSRYNTR